MPQARNLRQSLYFVFFYYTIMFQSHSDHIILVKMLFKVGLPAYLQSRKHLLRIYAFTIIRNHILAA